MNCRLRFLFQCLFVALISGCAHRTVPITSPGKYSEDLSGFRLKPDTAQHERLTQGQQGPVIDRSLYVEPRYTVNAPLHTVLDSIDRINLSKRFVEGYSIQIYSGNSREAALEARRVFTLRLPDKPSDLRYVQPNYQVKSGQYYSRLEAHKDYVVIRKFFGEAIIIPERIPIP